MRLYEITTPITPAKFEPQYAQSATQTGLELDDTDELGTGAFATAFSTRTEPGTVRKIVKPQLEDTFERDAYFKYVQLLTKHERFLKNPYFPKIYDIQVKTYEKNGGTYYTYAVDMERLDHWSSLSEEEALMLGKRMFHDYERLAKQHFKNNKGMPDQQRVSLLEFIRFDIFKGYGVRDFETHSTVFKDSDLKKAIMLIQSLENVFKGADKTLFFDIHAGNIMVRRTPGGPQLVFTDPVV